MGRPMARIVPSGSENSGYCTPVSRASSRAAAGRVSWKPPSEGRYSVYTRFTRKEAGEFAGQKYEEIREFATIAFTWPLESKGADPKAVALFELCRFREAQVVFTRLLSDDEHGAHAHQHLALLLEREGKLAEAEVHFRKARELSPEDFPAPVLLPEKEFRREVDRALGALPSDMRKDLGGVPVTVEDVPKSEDLLEGDPPLSPTILGLFRGPAIGEPCTDEDGPVCRSVVLYRKNLGRAVSSREELLEQIRVTLLHEIGHLRGEDDLELAARGLE